MDGDNFIYLYPSQSGTWCAQVSVNTARYFASTSAFNNSSIFSLLVENIRFISSCILVVSIFSSSVKVAYIQKHVQLCDMTGKMTI